MKDVLIDFFESFCYNSLMKLVDAHAHITDERFADLNDVIERSTKAGVTKIVCSGYDFLSSENAVNLSKKYPEVFATIGIHPENVEGVDFKQVRDSFINLAKNSKVVAVGEIGLDYHWTKETICLQKEVFIKQIQLANELNLPLVVHSRDAIGDTIEILKENKPNKESLIHCYGGSVESAKLLLEMGYSFSFGGVLTFSNAKTAVEVVKFLPMDKILLETDCPYLSPVPFRGQRNEPKNVVYVCDMIARIKGLKIEDVAEKTTENSKRVFGI